MHGCFQGRRVHAIRVSSVSPVNYLKNEKQKVFCLTFVVQWYSVHWDTAEPIRKKCLVSQSQSARRSRRAQASTSWLKTLGWLKLANDAFYLIDSAVFQCMEYHWATKVRQKTFYFSFLKVLDGLTRLTWTLSLWLFPFYYWLTNSMVQGLHWKVLVPFLFKIFPTFTDILCLSPCS
jgi:hypothetical protein